MPSFICPLFQHFQHNKFIVMLQLGVMHRIESYACQRFFFFWIRLIVWLSEQPFNNYINLDGTDLCFSIEIYYNFAFVAFNNQLRRLLYWWNLFLCEYWGSFLEMYGRSLLNLDKNHVRSVNACDTSWHRTLHRRIRFHDDSGWYDFVDMLGP